MCGKYKSAMSNLGSVDKFRMRYIKKTKGTKTIKFEKIQISRNRNSFCPRMLGDFFVTGDKIMYENTITNLGMKNVSSDFTVQYNQNTGRFVLFYVVKIPTIVSTKVKQVSLDPGIRTFLTGYSNDHCIKIANNLYNGVKTNLNKIDKINNSHIKPSIKKKRAKKQQTKITNKIDDLHWKTIKYLTDNYKDIAIGNMSTKQIGRGTLYKMVKRVASHMRLYVFKQRLKYKCSIKGVKYLETNEKYTSKFCSKCGLGYNFNLGTSEIYNCRVCKNVIDRDINGAKNIIIKSIK